MAHQFAALTFTPTVRELQNRAGSRSSYAPMDEGDDYNHLLTEREAGFIAQRDSMYMASVSETGWPYIQHRGGPVGFVKIIDESHIGFADYSGNRQYLSTGNFLNNDRVALFFMDYPNRRRLKLLGRVTQVDPEMKETLQALSDDDYVAMVEKAFVIRVEAFDWNCPQHITPRFTEQQIREELLPRLDVEQKPRVEVRQSAEVLGEGPLGLVVSGMRQLTPSVRSFELRSTNGEFLPAFEAGAHLRIPIRLASGELTEREYSITSDPANRQYYEIAVLRESHGRGGSDALHEGFALGTRLNVEAPINQFPIDRYAKHALLIAGGIGITPMRSMAYELRHLDKPFQLHYAGKSTAEMAFVSELEQEFGARLSTYTSENRLDLKELLSRFETGGLIYVCGPERLIAGVLQAARELEIPTDTIRFERFE